MTRALLPLAIALVLAGTVVPSAGAHSLVRATGTEITSLSADATSLNTLTARLSRGRIELRDPTVDGGMDPGTCEPGDVDETGFIVQVFCARRGVTLLRIDVGDREDTVSAVLPVPLLLLGGQGADKLRAGPAADTVNGDAGDDELRAGGGADRLLGGPGVDDLDSGAGDDDVRVRDGEADTVECGPGDDVAQLDFSDVIREATAQNAQGSCERVVREQPNPDDAREEDRSESPREDADES